MTANMGRGTSEPLSSYIASAKGWQEINGHTNSAYFDGFNYNLDSMASQVSPSLPIDPKAKDPRHHLGVGKESVRINLIHACRFCKRRFSSGRALGGHMRIHGSQFAESMDEEEHISSSCSWIEFKDFQSHQSASQTKSCDEEEDAMSGRAGSSSSETKVSPVHPLYALRRNPKRNQRFTDQEFAFGASAAKGAISASSSESTRICPHCGKQFLSWKALFGHMRCHPGREWRGIQPRDSALGVARSSEIFAPKRRSVVCGIASGIKLEPDLEKSKEQEVSMVIVQGREKEAANNRKEVEDEVNNTTNVNGVDGQRRASSRKLSDNDSDMESIQRGSADTRSHHHGWVTGKRSKRSRHTLKPLQILSYQERELDVASTPSESKEELDMADCLVMLAYAGKSIEQAERTHRQLTEESALSDSGNAWVAKDGAQRNVEDSDDEEMNWTGKQKKDTKGLKLQELDEDEEKEEEASDVREQGVRDNLTKFECSTCKRIFNSHQALGGHRASHRRVKGCFAKTNAGDEGHESLEEDVTYEEYLKLDDELPNRPQSVHGKEYERSHGLYWGDGRQTMVSAAERKYKAHECSICHRVFASGQALGGHKRCHWTGEKGTETTTVVSSRKQSSSLHGGQKRAVREDLLDLNLPAPLDDDDDLEVAYGMAHVVPAGNKLLDSKGGEEGRKICDFTKIQREHDALRGDSQFEAELHCVDTSSIKLGSRGKENREANECQQLERGNGQAQLDFTSKFVHCNVCDSMFNSLEALSNHQTTHSSLVPSVAGLTPISA